MLFGVVQLQPDECCCAVSAGCADIVPMGPTYAAVTCHAHEYHMQMVD